ncbi:MAG: sugar ABC transporter permease, partial [Parvibaculaceae bacterium]
MAARDAAQPRGTIRQPTRRKSPPALREKVPLAWLFLAPLVATLLAVAAWPLLRTMVFSLTDANLSDLTAWK